MNVAAHFWFVVALVEGAIIFIAAGTVFGLWKHTRGFVKKMIED